MGLDPIFTFVVGPCFPTLHFVYVFRIMMIFNNFAIGYFISCSEVAETYFVRVSMISLQRSLHNPMMTNLKKFEMFKRRCREACAAL
jgi:hypothetical protein